jgi:hypothetical protein
MSDGRKNNGGHSTKGKAGRPPKADEQKLIETLKPLMPAAYKALESALKEEHSWAVKLAMEYFYGKPHQTVDNNIKVEEIKRPEWFDEE